MAKNKIRVTIKDETQQLASFEFLHAFGLAMAQWAALERALYWWFERATRIRKEMASSIFYGARGFRARAEMIESILEHATLLSTTEVAFLKEAIKKAKQFSVFRNTIAHGEPRQHVTRKGDEIGLDYRIVQAKYLTANQGETLAVEDIRRGADNIHTLQRCITEMTPWLRRRNKNLRSREECLAQVLALPIQAHLKNDPSTEEHGPQPQGPSRPNKKAYRAAQAAKKAKKS
jgi:hypothetical protein